MDHSGFVSQCNLGADHLLLSACSFQQKGNATQIKVKDPEARTLNILAKDDALDDPIALFFNAVALQ